MKGKKRKGNAQKAKWDERGRKVKREYLLVLDEDLVRKPGRIVRFGS